MPASQSTQDRIAELCNRGNDEVDKNAFENAKNLYAEALSIGEDAMVPDMRLGVRETLAECYSRLKDFDAAAKCNRETLRILEEDWTKDYGSLHLLAMRARRNLASNLSDLSDQPGAPGGALQEAVDLRTKNIGILKSQNKPKTLADAQHKVAFDIAKLARSKSSASEADNLFRQAASMYEEVFSAWINTNESASSHRLINAKHNYGVVLYELGNFSEAKRVFLENQATLASLSESSRKGLKLLERNGDRYLASCIEKTNDLSLGISRRPNGPLSDAKESSTPELRVQAPDAPTKPKLKALEPEQTGKKDKSIPGAFPDAPSESTDAVDKLFRPPLDSKKPKGGLSKTGMDTAQPADGTDKIPRPGSVSPSRDNQPTETSSKSDTNGERNSRPRQQASKIEGNEYDKASSRPKSPSLLSNESGTPKRSRSDPSTKLLLEPEKTRKARSRSSAGIEKEEPEDRSDVSSAVDGELLGYPAAANDADIWMIHMRRHAHTLLQYNAPLTNRKRIRVAILDSGVQRGTDKASSRSDIWRRRARLKEFKDFTGSSATWTDSSKESHGTNCASLLLQVAPEADIYVATIVRPGEDGMDPAHVAEALKWAIGEKKVDIISMSFGWENWKHQVAEQINQARQKHILVFAAASNDGRLKPDYGVYPAWEPTVFCINASSGSGNKWERNPVHSDDKVNLMFLGEDIAILGSNNKPEFPAEERLTGTSFATPIAAGTAALVLDLVRLRASTFPKVERCLKTYEGMSAVFQAMSGKPTKDGYYHVMPWNMLGKDKPPFSPVGVNETNQWYSLGEVAKCLRRFGEVDEQLE